MSTVTDDGDNEFTILLVVGKDAFESVREGGEVLLHDLEVFVIADMDPIFIGVLVGHVVMLGHLALEPLADESLELIVGRRVRTDPVDLS